VNIRLFAAGMGLAMAAVCWGDTITLKSGRILNGTFLGGTARQVRFDTGERVETLEVSDVVRIEFAAPEIASAPAAEAVRPAAPRTENVMRPEAAAPSTQAPAVPWRPAAPAARSGTVELAAGTNIVVRVIDGVDSETSRPGQTFAASLDEPVLVNGETVIPRGADAVLKLVDSKDSGKLTGRAELTLDLVSVTLNGKRVELNTQTVSQASDSRGERTAKVAGGTAIVGAIIGGIAAGGKGAALGAAAGGAAGAGAQIITKGQRVKIPSETRLTFALDAPVRL
jgi:hypothetical protein